MKMAQLKQVYPYKQFEREERIATTKISSKLFLLFYLQKVGKGKLSIRNQNDKSPQVTKCTYDYKMTFYNARVDKSTHSDGYQVHALVSIDSFLAHSCWKQWMRYRGGADVDGSCRPWTEVVFRGRNFHSGPWTEVVSHATPPYLVKVKINFNQRITVLTSQPN